MSAPRSHRLTSTALALFALAVLAAPVSAAEGPVDTTYAYREPSASGTGKLYMGREIALTMGHAHANWLDRPARAEEDAPDAVVAALGLAPTDVVADIGAGTGYFTFRMSPLVPRGRVLAVDIQPEMLDEITQRMAADRVDNVVPARGTVTDPGLEENSVDVALIVDAYHEFSHPREMMLAVRKALRPGGRLVLVEFRLEDPEVPIKPLHKMSQAQARAEMAAAGLEWVETRDILPRQHFMVFRKPEAP
jgi:ubiquinone/menaquinone biosynthesis C-methylase UbiE